MSLSEMISEGHSKSHGGTLPKEPLRRINNTNKPKVKIVVHRPLSKEVSVLPTAPERVNFNFSLCKKEHESFGITIVGGVGSLSGAVYIKTISSQGVCGIDGNLKVGDQIIELNGQNMLQATHEEAIDIFRQCKTDINIGVARMLVDGNLLASKPISSTSAKSNFCHIISKNPDSSNEEPIILEHKNLTMI